MDCVAGYVHGYSERESDRLRDQAQAVRNLLHHDTLYPPGALVLEAGCGVGAQTVTLAAQSPDTNFVCIDISPCSLAQAQEAACGAGLTNVTFEQADIYNLPFTDATFDHIFLCYVLEHVPDPERALTCLRRVLRPGGTLTSIEGDHGSCYWHPETEASRRAWQCLIDVQAQLGGDSLIGRRLYPLLSSAGFDEVRVSPRMIYADASLPVVCEQFVGNTIIPMVEGVHEEAIQRGMIDEATWAQGMADLAHVRDSADGTFCYTFFKATAAKL